MRITVSRNVHPVLASAMSTLVSSSSDAACRIIAMSSLTVDPTCAERCGTQHGAPSDQSQLR
eukprot:29880-Eustigmatos_ZCMA.PRE.1